MKIASAIVFSILLISSLYLLFAFVSLNFWWIPVVEGAVRFFFGVGIVLSIFAGIIFYEENKNE